MTDSAKSVKLSWNDSFTRSLACAALSPGLRSVLVFDTSPGELRLAAKTIALGLKVVTGCEVVQVTLGTYESEDDLWGSLGLSSQSEEQPFCWQSGLLTGGRNETELRLVVIPDLTKLSLAAARACVMLVDTDVAHLERHGQQAYWQPNLCWLAGCASSEVGMVSPHLLDRFALRLSGRVTETRNRVKEILEWIDNRTLSASSWLNPPHPLKRGEFEAQLQKALQHHQPEIKSEAIARIWNYTSELEVYSPRREIALARLSLANAWLDGADQMTSNHVDVAAQMIGLKPVTRQAGESLELPSEPSESVPPQAETLQPTATEPTLESSSLPSNEPQKATVREPVYQSGEPEALPEMPLTVNSAPFNPYLEDEAPVEREAASLRLPTRRFRAKAAARGTIIGVEKTTTPFDLALVRTLLEAAKFQPIRQQEAGNGKGRLILSPKDLHRYRRAPVAEQMLILLLDHTCLRDCHWREALLPYLSWAYVERASVCLIQVGAAKNFHKLPTDTVSKAEIHPEELRAEKVMEQSLLVPRISAGIEAGRGRATPLAHGLDLALQTLRRALQHGRTTVQQAVLVAISDGRGNVPLEASRVGKIKSPVGRKGVKDALQVAEQIRGLDNVKVVLLNPQPQQYKDLPLELAEALGAAVVAIPSLEVEEVR